MKVYKIDVIDSIIDERGVLNLEKYYVVVDLVLDIGLLLPIILMGKENLSIEPSRYIL